MQYHATITILSAVLAAASLVAPPSAAGSARPAPEWVRQIPPGTWAAVNQNTLAELNPALDPEVNPAFPTAPPWKATQQAVIGAWNGGAFATGYGRSGALIVAGGGHADYYGNEVYAFDLETRLWQRLTNPYRTPSFPVANGIWPDGTPSVSHTYDQVDYHPGTNSFVMMKTQHDNTGGQSSPVVAMFSLDGLQPADSNRNRDANRANWRLSPVHPDNYTQSGGWSVYDSRRDVFWANGGSGTRTFVRFDPKPVDGDQHGSFQSFPHRSGVTDAVAAYDPVNDIIVYTVFRNAPEIWAVDLSYPEAGRAGNIAIQQSGFPPPREAAHGWEWSPLRRAFLYYRRGSGVFELKQQGNDWRSDPWQWAELTSSENALIPLDEARNGVYSKFRIASFSDAEVALVVNSAAGPVYAFRIPEAESPRHPRSPAALKAR